MENAQKNRRFFMAVVLAVGFASFGCDKALHAAEELDEDVFSVKTPKKRKPLVFDEKEKSRVFEACDRSVRMNLNGPATTGDVEEVCSCVDSAFVASEGSIPEQFRTHFLFQHPQGEVINLAAIKDTERGDLVPGKVKIVARNLGWEVQSCLGRLPVRGQLLGMFPGWWKDGPNQDLDFLGPIVTPTEGPAGPVDKDLGGLLFVTLQHPQHVVWHAFRYGNEDVNTRLDARERALKFLNRFGPDVEAAVVLQCKYRTQAENTDERWLVTAPYFYWYRPAWSARVEEIVKSAPSDHPIKQIGSPRDTCPLRRPRS